MNQKTYESDLISTSAGDLEITFLGHGSLMMAFNGKVIHIDPYSDVADYTSLPAADLVLLTHHHGDHLDADALSAISSADTPIILTKMCAKTLKRGTVMQNGDENTMFGINIKAVPAYNIVNMRPSGGPYHPRGEGNGYVLTFGDTTVYIGGDTENIPEMAELKDIDVAFLPMNLPYTMTPEMVADAANMLNPAILYPYHFGKTDTMRLVELLKDKPSIEVRIRQMA